MYSKEGFDLFKYLAISIALFLTTSHFTYGAKIDYAQNKKHLNTSEYYEYTTGDVLSNYSKEELTNQILHGFEEDVVVYIKSSIQNKRFDFESLKNWSNLRFCDSLFEAGFFDKKEYDNLLLEIINCGLTRNEECLTKHVNYLAFEHETSNDDDSKNRTVGNRTTYPSITNPITYTKGHFSIVLSSTNPMSNTEIDDVFEHLEYTRSYYLNNGFELPILEPNRTTYYLYFDDVSNPGEVAYCQGIHTNGNTCDSYICVHNFTSLTNYKKEVLAHEYFHAIQFAYNYRHSWFSEASANLSKLVVCRTSDSLMGWQHSAINFTDSLENLSGYAYFYFPLTIYRDYGGIYTIRKIYENYHNLLTSMNEKYFRVLIDETLQTLGYSASFETVFRKMCLYIYNPTQWFTSIVPSSVNWTRNSSDYISTSTSSNNTISITMKPDTASFYRTTIPNNYNKNIVFKFSNDISKLFIDIYCVKTDGTHIIEHECKMGADRTVTISKDMACNLAELGIVISNPNLENIVDTLEISVPIPPIRYMGAEDRTIEVCGSLENGEEIFETIEFAISGYYVIQTFSSSDCVLKIYSSANVLLASNDDGGYSRNSFIRYYFPADELFRVSVKFYNLSKSGFYRLFIVRSSGVLSSGSSQLNSYSDILMLNYTSSTFSHSQTLAQGEADIYRFKSNQDKDIVFDVSTEDEIDTFLYVLDPTESTKSKNGIDYDDDSGADYNGKLVKSVKANQEYVVVVVQYDPSNISSNRNYTISFSESNLGPRFPNTLNHLDIVGVKKHESGKWVVSFINQNPYRIRVDYNAKMCFQNDAKNFANLSDIQTIHLGAFEVGRVIISENFLAGYITISLKFSINTSSKRLVTYANNLSNVTYACSPAYNTL